MRTKQCIEYMALLSAERLYAARNYFYVPLMQIGEKPALVLSPYLRKQRLGRFMVYENSVFAGTRLTSLGA